MREKERERFLPNMNFKLQHLLSKSKIHVHVIRENNFLCNTIKTEECVMASHFTIYYEM